MFVYDKLGRTWKGRKIVWIKSSNNARLALYRWVFRDGKKKLIYDKKRGMYDKDGYHIQEMRVDIIPALEGRDKNKNPIPKTWERFPNTDEACSFIKSITINGIANQEKVYFEDEYEDEYEEEIIIK